MPDLINILLVDDEQRNLDALESILDEPGYRLLRADDADKALRLLLENDVAAIVLDIKMPGYLNSLAADLKDDQLQGEVVLNKLGENKDQHMPFHAQLGVPYRFYPPAQASTAPIPTSPTPDGDTSEFAATVETTFTFIHVH